MPRIVLGRMLWCSCGSGGLVPHVVRTVHHVEDYASCLFAAVSGHLDLPRRSVLVRQ